VYLLALRERRIGSLDVRPLVLDKVLSGFADNTAKKTMHATRHDGLEPTAVLQAGLPAGNASPPSDACCVSNTPKTPILPRASADKPPW